MNPFVTPDAIFISPAPQDMRAGIHRLSSIVASEFGQDPTDGALYIFVSRNCSKAKMLRFDVNGWVMYYCTLSTGTFRWNHSDEEVLLTIERRQLYWLLEGLEIEQSKAAKPVAATAIL